MDVQQEQSAPDQQQGKRREDSVLKGQHELRRNDFWNSEVSVEHSKKGGTVFRKFQVHHHQKGWFKKRTLEILQSVGKSVEELLLQSFS